MEGVSPVTSGGEADHGTWTWRLGDYMQLREEILSYFGTLRA